MTRSALFLIAVLLSLLPVASLPARGASGVLIVTGLTGSSENDEEFQKLSEEIKRLAVERGFPVDGVETMSGKVTRADVLAHLAARSGKSAAGDEFWLILLGHSGKSLGGVPAFQVSGPRLTAADLKGALDAVQGTQFVFIATNESGPFLPLLQDKRRTILSATKSENESDQPRFPSMWVSAFGERPHAPLTWIAARAAELVDHEYVTSQIAQSEHARLADPVTGKILEPPFGTDLSAPPEIAAAPRAPARLMDASDIKVEMKNPDAEWEEQPATDETKKLIAAARALPNPDGHSALMMEQRIGYTVEDDRTTDAMTFYRIFIAREDAVEEWANHYLPQSPPAVTTKLQVARVIRPDGSSVVFNPDKLAGGIDPDSGAPNPTGMVFLPDTHAGCLIELGYQTRAMLEATLPEVSENFPIQQEIPIFKTSLEIRVPEKQTFRVVLNNDKTPAQESTENGRHVYRWELPPIAALEHLEADPPVSTFAVWLGISSLPSWDEFAQWFRRLAAGSDTIDATVQKAAKELSVGANTRMEKIRRTFEFVSALRYVAIEIGVQGFRPRTPAEVLANRYGDCKDKANLIVALLGCQGIDAHLVLLDRGGETDVNFPSWQFNHAIAYVPKATDKGQPQDLWLDSTDSVTPFGFVAPGDFGRAGLVFSKDKAEFKTIASEQGSISMLSDEWDLSLDGSNGWTGQFHRRATGLAEDAVRRIFRGLTPLQRRARVYDMAGRMCAAGDFADAAVSDVSSLHEAIDLSARLRASSRDLPGVELPWLDVFAPPDRDRPVLLNDGQPLAATQTLRLSFPKGAPKEIPASFDSEISGEKFSVAWTRPDANSLERTATVAFNQTSISTAQYAGVRRAVLSWKAAVAHDDLQNDNTHP